MPPQRPPFWYELPHVLEMVLELSMKISVTFPIERNRIFSLGQSPAWVIKGCEFLNNSQQTHHFGYIAFSSFFCERQYPGSGKRSLIFNSIYTKSFQQAKFKINTEKIPNAVRIRKYREYLNSIGLNVEKIIALYVTRRIKTVIIDTAFSGAGLISFMHILCTWAKELGTLQKLKQAVQLVNIDGDAINELVEPTTGTSFSLYNIKCEKGDCITYRDTYGYGPDNTRIVAYYPSDDWNNPPLPCRNEHVEPILRRLEGSVRSNPRIASLRARI